MTDLEKKEKLVREKIEGVKLLEKKLWLARKETNEILKDYLLSRDGLKVGDKVKDHKYTYVVCDIDMNGVFGLHRLRTANYWLIAKKIKKDGTPFQNTCTVYRDWEKVEEDA